MLNSTFERGPPASGPKPTESSEAYDLVTENMTEHIVLHTSYTNQPSISRVDVLTGLWTNDPNSFHWGDANSIFVGSHFRFNCAQLPLNLSVLSDARNPVIWVNNTSGSTRYWFGFEYEAKESWFCDSVRRAINGYLRPMKHLTVNDQGSPEWRFTSTLTTGTTVLETPAYVHYILATQTVAETTASNCLWRYLPFRVTDNYTPRLYNAGLDSTELALLLTKFNVWSQASNEVSMGVNGVAWTIDLHSGESDDFYVSESIATAANAKLASDAIPSQEPVCGPYRLRYCQGASPALYY